MKNTCNFQMMLNKENLVETFLNERSGNPVFLYGIGAGVIWYIKLFENLSIPIAGLCDGFIEEEKEISFDDESKKTYKAYPLERVYENYGLVDYVIAAPKHRRKIKETLEKGMYSGIYIFDAAPIVLQGRMPEEYREYVKNNIGRFETVYKMLEDEASKRVMLNCMAGWITSDCNYYEKTASSSQYFPDIVRKVISGEEVFVDVGAFDGDSIEEFLNCVGGDKFKKVIAFEPEPISFNKGKDKYSDPRISFYQYGVGNKNDTMNIVYANGAEGTMLSAGKGEQKEDRKVEIIRLDDFIQDKVTYVKMDIEGMELEALKGAERSIKRDTPKLAISIYHKMEDMIEIIDYINRINPKYKFYMRHYWDCSGTDVVLFAL